MKVKELIEKLQSLPQDSRVVLNGYEGGINDCTVVKENIVYLDVNEQWYYGKHELVDEFYLFNHDEKTYLTAPVVHIY